VLPNKKSSTKKNNSNKASKQQDVPVESTKDTVLVERRQKSHQDDIEKWTQRVKECNESKTTPMSIDVPVHDNVEEQVSRTKSGKPVCMICKRKFINMEKLEQHQLLSQLHKFNLGKLARANGGKHRAYLDRAYNRRVLYESQTVEPVLDVGEVGQLLAPNLEEARKVVVSETVRPEDNLGDTNIGNKMLQKLGWDGGSLGRKVSSDNQRGSEALKNEWKRIEALAKH
jgi:G-patch domain.